MAFCGLTTIGSVPDPSLLSRFRAALANKNTFEQLLQEMNRQLEANGVQIGKGVIVDASVTPTARKPKGKKTYHLPEQGNTSLLKEVKQKGVDQEASWVKRGNRLMATSVTMQ